MLTSAELKLRNGQRFCQISLTEKVDLIFIYAQKHISTDKSTSTYIPIF